VQGQGGAGGREGLGRTIIPRRPKQTPHYNPQSPPNTTRHELRFRGNVAQPPRRNTMFKIQTIEDFSPTITRIFRELFITFRFDSFGRGRRRGGAGGGEGRGGGGGGGGRVGKRNTKPTDPRNKTLNTESKKVKERTKKIKKTTKRGVIQKPKTKKN